MGTFNSYAIRTIRKNLNLSQKDFAKLLGRSQNTISQWENSIRQPDLASMELIASKLGLSLSDLINTNNEDENISHFVDDNLQENDNRHRLLSTYIFSPVKNKVYRIESVKNIIKDDFTKRNWFSNLDIHETDELINRFIFCYSRYLLYSDKSNKIDFELIFHYYLKELRTEISNIIFNAVNEYCSTSENIFLNESNLDLYMYIDALIDKNLDQ